MGTLLAYGVALRLEQDGAPPLTRLYVSGRRAPSRYRLEVIHDDAGIIAELRRLSGTNADLLGDPETLESYRKPPSRVWLVPVRSGSGSNRTSRSQPRSAGNSPTAQ